jgi:rhamnosyltransferase
LPDEAPTLRSSIIVLSAGASPFLGEVIECAAEQRGERDELVLLWSGAGPPPAYSLVDRVLALKPEEFNHGGTRRLSVESARGEFVVFLSDDATPHEGWLKAILDPMHDRTIGACYGRQVPRSDAPVLDRVFREARYPRASLLLKGGRGRLLIATAPVSNANAAYRVKALTAVGNFPADCSFAEDREAALRLLNGGWSIRYVADAVASHTHYHTATQTVRRGEAAAAFHLVAGWGTLASWSAFGLRAVSAAWRAGGVGALLSVAYAVGLRALGMIRGRTSPSRTRQPAGAANHGEETQQWK